MSDILQRIRDLQHEDKNNAETLLLSFIRETLPFDVVSLKLTPSAVSLNSFNGFFTLADGTKRFFKTHTETDTVIDEYYNAEMLASAGYPVIQPVFKSTEPGKQLLVYEVIEDPSVFDLAWQIETTNDHELLSVLRDGQGRADNALLQLYQSTLVSQSATDAAKAPIHQLFYHRLTGGRLSRFYGAGAEVLLPNAKYSMQQVRRMQWIINGQEYLENLDAIIARAIKLLKPAQAGPSVIGHGDAHNGNVFFRQDEQPPSFLYFDPAFAGRHHPLLDLTKPLFHNVFAMWMYFPHEKRESVNVSVQQEADTLVVAHDYDLHPVRMMFLESKFARTLKPILRVLHRQNLLRDDWRAYLKAALFCCPFLTMNLSDSKRFSPEISLLGLAMSVEMGSESKAQRRSLIDQKLDEIDKALQ